MTIFELRQYYVRPGKQAEWLELMEAEIIPFNVSKGMRVTASFIGDGDETLYVWLRAFESEAARVKLYEAVYESDHWKNVLAPRCAELLDREQMKVTRLVPTATSAMH